jgi:hypothetical protein
VRCGKHRQQGGASNSNTAHHSPALHNPPRSLAATQQTTSIPCAGPVLSAAATLHACILIPSLPVVMALRPFVAAARGVTGLDGCADRLAPIKSLGQLP